MQELAKGGLSAATIQAGALEGTLQLAAAGGTTLASAAEIASNALNTSKLSGDQMNVVSAALAGGANASTASVESL
ncbi:phage tail tape measure protein, partial [Promicromonospora kroppenstedtii]|uniref:phage tail tape measure protein n=1 Tax=Promicromonospora kroppenstedtii TaxID=440482 RepID=UPI000568C275